MQLYLSLSAYGGVTTREALATFWEADIRHVELAIGPRRESDATLAIRDFQQQGMVYRAHHAFVWGTDHRSFNLAGRFDSDYFVSLVEASDLFLIRQLSKNTQFPESLRQFNAK